jgi:hypothetical protein
MRSDGKSIYLVLPQGHGGEWLMFKRANLQPPLPDTPESKQWSATRQPGTTMPATDLK